MSLFVVQSALEHQVHNNYPHKIALQTVMLLGPTPSTTTPSTTTLLPNTTSNITDGSGSGGGLNLIINLIPDPPHENSCDDSLHKVYDPIDNQIDQIAIENANNVDVYIWSTSPTMQHKLYTSKVFAKKLLNVKFKYIGSTTEGWLTMLTV